MALSRLAAAALAAALCAVPATRADDWESYQHDAQHTGLSTSRLDPGTLAVRWSSPDGFHQPLIVGNAVYGIETNQTSNPTQIASFNLANGNANWTFSATYLGASGLVYGSGLVAYTGSISINSQIVSRLYVLNAATGAPVYSVVIPEGPGNSLTLATDTTSGGPVAYVSDGRGSLTAVRLGPTSGTTLWTATGLLAGAAPPGTTSSLVVSANVDHYYAINRATGAVNQFYSGPASGGVGYTPTIDSASSHFYLVTNRGIIAYSYGPSGVTQLWLRTGAGIHEGDGVAIGPGGKIFTADTSTLVELDPTDGHTLASVSGRFSFGNTPLINDGFVWEVGPGSIVSADTYVYNLSNLSPAAHLAGVVGYSGTAYTGAPALDDTHYIFDYSHVSDVPGFIVYGGTQTPEPASIAWMLLVAGGLAKRRRNRTRQIRN